MGSSHGLAESFLTRERLIGQAIAAEWVMCPLRYSSLSRVLDFLIASLSLYTRHKSQLVLVLCYLAPVLSALSSSLPETLCSRRSFVLVCH